jgi:NitT/TauT family transport system permease protein
MFKKLFKFGGESDFGTIQNIIISIIGFIIIILGWHFISVNEIIPTNILPDPFKVVGSYGTLISEYHMLGNAWFSLKMNLLCYVYAIGLSLPIGFMITLCPLLNLLISRYITSIRFLPFVAISSIFVSIFGLTFNMKVWFLTAALMVYIIPAIVNKINDLQNPKNDKDNVYLQTIQTMGASNWEKFRYVYWPYVTSGVADTCRDLLAVSWTYVTVAELIYKDGEITGLGASINTMIRQSHIPEAYALIVLIIAIGFVQDFVFAKIIKKLFPYKK